MMKEAITKPAAATLATKAAAVQQKYLEERNKRVELRPEGIAQYIDLSKSKKYSRYQEDPFFDRNIPLPPVPDFAKFVIVGAGFGGLLFAVRLIQTGVMPSEIRVIDSAGGFGGTWYWNRYPGIMCDVESYIYLPLLEEMGYMPKHKYSYGPEILNYVNAIVAKWGLHECGVFRQQVKNGKWHNEKKQWTVDLESVDDKTERTIRAEFMLIAPGVLSAPKLPGIPGIDDYQGHSFHTSRWDYDYTGGSPIDPSLTKLRNKTVGIIGTGATTVQALPHLAKYSKKLFVFQRTPSSIDVRGQKPTDLEDWEQIIKSGNGWQRQRSDNFNAHISRISPLPENNLVNDGWSSMRTYCAVVGIEQEIPPEKAPGYIASLHDEDMVRAERIRARVDEIVANEDTAQKLKHWYPSWCKRPCFHDEYLKTFNQPNVILIDTAGKGVDRITSTGLVVGDQEFPIDVLIFSTGFVSPSTGNAAPTERAGITITGRDGVDLQDKLNTMMATLHGVCSRSFPNLFWPGPLQGGVAANHARVLDEMAKHVAYIISEANKRGDKVIIEPTADAEEQWAFQILSMSASGAAMIGCTPSYNNLEGAVDRILELTPEEQMRAGRAGIWGKGLLDFVRVIEDWRARGSLSGLEVNIAV